MAEPTAEIVAAPSKLPSLLDAGQRALAEAADDFDRLRVRDSARAVQAAALILDRRSIAVAASVLVADAERAIVAANPPRPPGRPPKLAPPPPAAEIVAPGETISPAIDSKAISKMRTAHAPLDDDAYANAKAQAVEEGELVTRATLRRAQRARKPSLATAEDPGEWYTPERIIEVCHDTMGAIDLDPCSHPHAMATVRAHAAYTAVDDGLDAANEWAGRVFLSPPRRRPLMLRAVDRLLQERKAGHVTQAILLMPARTESLPVQRVMTDAALVCCVAGNAGVWRPDGDTPRPQGYLLAYWGDSEPHFAAAASELGVVMRAAGRE